MQCRVRSPSTTRSGRRSRPRHRSGCGESSYEVLGETDELELATELLAVTDERELDQFLGNLIRKIARSAGAAVRSPLGQAIGRGLKGIIRQTLPLAGTALGTMAGGPLGAAIGSGLATTAGRALGLELEGLSHEDQELEATKRFVRFASNAVRNAASAPASGDPADTATSAIAAAARSGAPGLLPFLLSARRRGARAPIQIRTAEDSMHDIDRTQLEADYEGNAYEFEQSGWGGETGDVFGETEEMELASALMEVRDEMELDQFLGSLIRKAGRALGRLVGSPEGQAIGSILKGAAKQVLPHAAGAVGAAFGGPLGARISSGIASLVGGEMEMEMEAESGELGPGGLEPGSVESENPGIRRILEPGRPRVRRRQAVRACRSRHRAERDGRGGHDGSDVGRAKRDRAGGRIPRARNAAAGPALRHGAVRSGQYPGAYSGGESGRWMRRGNRIILFGV